MRIERDYFWFRLFKTRGIGQKSLLSIANILETQHLHPEMLPRSQSVLSRQLPELAKLLGKIRAEDRDEVYAEYKQLERDSVDIIYPKHPDFPPHLLEISPVLFIKGPRKLLTSEGVAIVGARNVSDKGIGVARQLAIELACVGKNVVSGYAKGIDSEAHLGALHAEGTTTLVLPYGIKALRQKSEFQKFDWQRDVLAVSQFAPNVKWLAQNAMARNKLICAFSKAVIVVESGPERDARGKMSGTFDTAKTALNTKLPLFVLDPRYFDSPPKGNAKLIELGGRCLDPANGVEGIVKHISDKKKDADAKISASKKPVSPIQEAHQLELPITQDTTGTKETHDPAHRLDAR